MALLCTSAPEISWRSRRRCRESASMLIPMPNVCPQAERRLAADRSNESPFHHKLWINRMAKTRMMCACVSPPKACNRSVNLVPFLFEEMMSKDVDPQSRLQLWSPENPVSIYCPPLMLLLLLLRRLSRTHLLPVSSRIHPEPPVATSRQLHLEERQTDRLQVDRR